MNDEKLIKIIKMSKEPIRSMEELSHKLVGTRDGVFFYTSSFRLDFEKICDKLANYEKGWEKLKDEINTRMVFDGDTITYEDLMDLIWGIEDRWY